MINFEELIQIVKDEHMSKLTDKFRPFSFLHGEDEYVVVLSYKQRIQIVVFHQFGYKGFFCKATIMDYFNAIYIAVHTVERFKERFTQSPKYSMLELLAKELLYLINSTEEEGWYYTKHGRFYVCPHPAAIACWTFYREYKQKEIDPDINWFIEL